MLRIAETSYVTPYPKCLLPLPTPTVAPVTLILFRTGNRLQPGLSAYGPEFVGWLEEIGPVEGAEVDFDFIIAAGENRRAAAGAEETLGMAACLAGNHDGIFWENRGSVEQSAVVLAAIHTVTKANSVWLSRCYDPNLSAGATACEFIHPLYPQNNPLSNDDRTLVVAVISQLRHK